MNRRRRGSRSVSVSAILAIVLSVLLCINVMILIGRVYSDNQIYSYEYSSMMRELKSGDYPYVVDMIRTNEAQHARTEVDTSEFSAFADFYEASILYQTFRNRGETDRAEIQMRRMQEARSQVTTPEILNAMDDLTEEDRKN